MRSSAPASDQPAENELKAASTIDQTLSVRKTLQSIRNWPSPCFCSQAWKAGRGPQIRQADQKEGPEFLEQSTHERPDPSLRSIDKLFERYLDGVREML